jgi:hypothetical protein
VRNGNGAKKATIPGSNGGGPKGLGLQGRLGAGATLWAAADKLHGNLDATEFKRKPGTSDLNYSKLFASSSRCCGSGAIPMQAVGFVKAGLNGNLSVGKSTGPSSIKEKI